MQRCRRPAQECNIGGGRGALDLLLTGQCLETHLRTPKQASEHTDCCRVASSLPALLAQINPTIPFVDSSPSNGVIADNDREYVKRWGDDWDWRYGDVHW